MARTDDEISYEDISEIRRKEENSTLLSQIRPDFYKASDALIRRNIAARNKILIENPDMYDGISGRYRNTAAMLERVIFLRTNKIWHNALRDAATGSPAMPDNLTEEEKTLYTSLYTIAKAQFVSVNGSRTLFTTTIESVPVPKDVQVTETPIDDGTEEFFPPPEEEVPVEVAPEVKKEEIIPPMEDVILKDEEVLVRVLDDIPTFSGPERDYTLKKEDVVRLPSMMASALINRQKAVLIKTP